ncbi:ABC transporter ATP-binding protein [Sulfitobacter sp.]|uniref:ABC transporter ATP-binding protein n=1 Tax=Sulfitobacter sp. TaxID=1903071 RepID=UPI0030010468
MTSAAATLLECRNVSKHYGALAAVDGVDLRIGAGEAVGIGGPNGAGKTTFFDLISGLTAVSGGQVLFDGHSISVTAPHKLFHDGMARTFQITSGFGSLTVLENMLTSVVYGSGRETAGLLFKKRHLDVAMDTLETYGLSAIAGQLVSDITVLDRKKLMVASAVVHKPKIFLLDEPVGGLMPAEIDEFIALMQRLKDQGMTIVFIEHVMRFLTTVADRAVIMHQGKLIYDGQPAGIAKDELVKSVYLGSAAESMGAA